MINNGMQEFSVEFHGCKNSVFSVPMSDCLFYLIDEEVASVGL